MQGEFTVFEQYVGISGQPVAEQYQMTNVSFFKEFYMTVAVHHGIKAFREFFVGDFSEYLPVTVGATGRCEVCP